jgi:hypothetical protein
VGIRKFNIPNDYNSVAFYSIFLCVHFFSGKGFVSVMLSSGRLEQMLLRFGIYGKMGFMPALVALFTVFFDFSLASSKAFSSIKSTT